MKLPAFLLFLVAAVVATPAWARDPAPVVVTHVADAKKSETALRFSEELRIVLPAPADVPAGGEWQITSNDPRVLRLTGGPKPTTPADHAAAAEKAGAPIAPGAWITTFLALRPGRSVVRLAYVRPVADGELTAVASREINVVVN